ERQAAEAKFLVSLGRLDRAFPGDMRLISIREAYQNSAKLAPQLDSLMQAKPSEKAALDEPRAVLVEMTLDAGEIKEKLDGVRKVVESSVLEASASTESHLGLMVKLVVAYSALIFGIAMLVAHHIKARALAEDELAYSAGHDLVTGRLNRRTLETVINSLGGEPRQVVVISLERFHRLVGTLGHEVADAALRAVAERVETMTRVFGAQMFRLDGANFALLYPPPSAAAEGSDVHAILEAGAQPFQVGQYELLIAIVCGAARYPEDGGDAVNLIRNANTALQHAKRIDTRFYAYESSLNARSAERLALEAALGHAVERKELELFYQPQMDIDSGRIIGAEALVRWRRDGKLISPIEFIPIAEESGLIVAMGEWILREACRQAMAWKAAGLGEPVVAVNISARQFQDPRFFDTVTQALADTGVPPAMIELEITESAIMQDPDAVVAELERLRGLGLALAIDDFGTGYSSLSYLKRFPLDKLKVDQSFVRPLTPESPAEDSAIVEAVVRLGQTLGLKVIAEGVETEDQLALLGRLGCDEIQGYWFSKPMPLAEATAFLAARAPQAAGGVHGGN
ncbi:MAG TPA: bifunctional diguanylate cyclase/phosphodiesterase, partial [Rhodocyclaceae bacterium]